MCRTTSKVLPGPGEHPALYSMGSGVGGFLPPGGGGGGFEDDHSLTFSAEVKNRWSYAFAPPVCVHALSWYKCMCFTLVQNADAL
jgi:hypothetical protein